MMLIQSKLMLISLKMMINATESGDFEGALPDFIENKGLLEPNDYFDLLRSSAILIGVGQVSFMYK